MLKIIIILVILLVIPKDSNLEYLKFSKIENCNYLKLLNKSKIESLKTVVTVDKVISIYHEFDKLYFENKKNLESNFSLYKNQESFFKIHFVIMIIESELTDLKYPSRTDDHGICQINRRTFEGEKNSFLKDIQYRLNKENSYYTHLVKNKDNLKDMAVNVSFSLWYVYNLYIKYKGNLKDILASYNSGKRYNHPRLPKSTKLYVEKFEKYYNALYN